MKKLVLAALVLISSSAMADTTVFNCKVPDSQNVSLTITLGADQSVDFVTVSLVNKKTGAATFFSQMDKGSVAQQIQAGYLNLLALTDKSAQDDGVIMNTGFLGLSADNGEFSGFLAANGNIYPLSCTK
jgi:hypothetical protein